MAYLDVKVSMQLKLHKKICSIGFIKSISRFKGKTGLVILKPNLRLIGALFTFSLLYLDKKKLHYLFAQLHFCKTVHYTDHLDSRRQTTNRHILGRTEWQP